LSQGLIFEIEEVLRNALPKIYRLLMIYLSFNAGNKIHNIKTKHEFLYISHYRLFHTSVL
jgi:hypothetical protein